MMLGRLIGSSTGTPASRFATYRRTVFGSTPANSAAECAHPVASNASRISMISLSDFFTIPPSDSLGRRQSPRANPRRHLTFRTDTTAHNNLPNREISCPQEGKWRVRLQGSWTVRCETSAPWPRLRAGCLRLERLCDRRGVMVGRNAELSVRMRAHRARLALTQQEVADGLARVAWVEEGRSVGVNADMVSKWERGDKRPSRFYLRLLCSLYQTTPEGLGERTNPSASQPIASDTLPVAATGMFVPPYVDFDASSTDMELILPKLLQLWRKESMQRRDLL